ncbi:hypothetical protein CRG98_016210, partial [Punica granatum]
MKKGKGSGLSVGDLDPTTEWHAPTEDVDDHRGGVRAIDWRSSSRIDRDLEFEIAVDLGVRVTNRSICRRMQNTPTFRGGRVIWVGSILPMTSCRVDDSSANDSRAVCLPELKPQARVLLSLLSSPPLVLAAVAVDTEVDREGEMLRLNRLVQRSCSSTRASILTSHLSVYEEEKLTPLPSRHSAQRTSNRFLDIHQ